MDEIEKSERDLGLERFAGAPSDEGLSLESLEEAYIAALEAGEDPYAPAAAGGLLEVGHPVPVDPLGRSRDEDTRLATAHESETHEGRTDGQSSEEPPAEPIAAPVDVNPRSILEAMLFVGGQPLSAERVAGLMRGVRAGEIDDLVYELNSDYRRQGRPYTIVQQSGGYRLALLSALRRVSERLYGSPVREVRLSQAAIETLSLVAYRQPISRQEIDSLRGTNSGSLLRSLIRRGLLTISRGQSDSREVYYHTTDRFLEVFGLESLDDLPRPQDVDRL